MGSASPSHPVPSGGPCCPLFIPGFLLLAPAWNQSRTRVAPVVHPYGIRVTPLGQTKRMWGQVPSHHPLIVLLHPYCTCITSCCTRIVPILHTCYTTRPDKEDVGSSTITPPVDCLVAPVLYLHYIVLHQYCTHIAPILHWVTPLTRTKRMWGPPSIAITPFSQRWPLHGLSSFRVFRPFGKSRSLAYLHVWTDIFREVASEWVSRWRRERSG